MSRFVLDTDIATLLQQGHPVVTDRVRACRPDDVATTTSGKKGMPKYLNYSLCTLFPLAGRTGT